MGDVLQEEYGPEELRDRVNIEDLMAEPPAPRISSVHAMEGASYAGLRRITVIEEARRLVATWETGSPRFQLRALILKLAILEFRYGETVEEREQSKEWIQAFIRRHT